MEIWDDTLFMVVLFLAHYGTVSGRQELVDEAVRQFLLHARYLNDPQTGLWYHGWSFVENSNFAKARWARGNADYRRYTRITGTSRRRRGRSGVPDRVPEKQVNTLIDLQAANNGASHTCSTILTLTSKFPRLPVLAMAY